jgi:copper chaperone CopZ
MAKGRENSFMEYYIHYVPGRMRIQTPKLHENTGNAEQFERFVKGIEGVTAVETHTVTGSAIIHFDEKRINCEQVIGILEKKAYFSLVHAETSDEVIEKTTEKVLGVAERIIVDSLGGEPREE